MAKQNIKKNYIYNLSYQILLLITPLITTPYLARILGADGIGTVSYAGSIVSYFTLFACLGTTIYGQREISYVQENREKRSHVFWETKILQIITSLIVLLFYIPFALYQQNYIIYLILALNLLAVLVDVTWFFQGMEEFGKIVFRNFIFKIINIIYIFAFVETRDDLNVYIFGSSFFLFLSNASLWAYIPRYIEKPLWSDIKPTRNLKVVITLFIPTVAIQIYTVLDKTMIGLITQSAFENGYYEQALKISKMVMTAVTALGTVMIPRIGYHFAKGETETVISLIYRGYRFVWLFGTFLCFVLIGTAANFVPWFFGVGYDKVITLLGVLSFLILSIGINNVTGMQYLIPTNRQNLFTFTVLIGAAVNFMLNLILIHRFQSIGAAIASVVAETVIAFVQLWLVRKEFSVKKVFLSGLNYFVAGGVMLGLLKHIGLQLTPSITNTFLLLLCGAVRYCVVLLFLKDSFFIDNARNVFESIVKKIK